MNHNNNYQSDSFDFWTICCIELLLCYPFQPAAGKILPIIYIEQWQRRWQQQQCMTVISRFNSNNEFCTRALRLLLALYVKLSMACEDGLQSENVVHQNNSAVIRLNCCCMFHSDGNILFDLNRRKNGEKVQFISGQTDWMACKSWTTALIEFGEWIFNYKKVKIMQCICFHLGSKNESGLIAIAGVVKPYARRRKWNVSFFRGIFRNWQYIFKQNTSN